MSEKQKLLPTKLKKNEGISDALKFFDELPDSANVRLPIVLALFSCSKATLWRRTHDNPLLSPRRLSPRITVWNVGQLRQALQGIEGNGDGK